MAGKFDTIEDFAKELQYEGILKFVTEESTFRGISVNKVAGVYDIDRSRLAEKSVMIQGTLPKLDREIEFGARGAKIMKQRAEWRIEFIDDVLSGKIPTINGKKIQPVSILKPVETIEPVEAVAPVEPVEEGPIAEPEEPQETVQQTDVGGALGLLEKAVAQVFMQTQGKALAEEVRDEAIEAVKAFIEETYGTIRKKIVIETPQGDFKKVDGVLHERFDEVLAFVQADEPVFLCGPAGCGKNVLVKQVAEALGLDFYFSNAVTQEYKITGFTDAMGTFQESQFYKAFKNGGIFFLDEMDASIPEVLVILNAAIANRYFDFPAPIGYVEAHPDFRVVAAGNTLGQGASIEYVGRAQLDAASLNRFAVIKVGYDRNIETNCAQGDEALVDFIHDVRQASEKAGIKMVVSYRDISRIARMKSALGIKRAIETGLLKGMDKPDVDSLFTSLSNRSNVYAEAMRN